eukprot:TRINITY_DN111511_c0_g1_i1.p1 TRINITY_DN111511_c0_g1~~TRINITY_DN111511_c0_g1_i1.p1  ORF type:complete len:501 (+),score=129.37 TRINITY_DN111511_c0_g1_i1:136-1638(+)
MAEPQDMGDHEMVDWEAGAEELDADFRGQETVEIDLGSDDEPPSDDDLDGDPDAEIGTIDENAIYSDDDFQPGVDDALTSVSHKEQCLAVALSPVDRRVLVTGGQDDVAILWGLEDGWQGGVKCTQRYRLEGHSDSVVAVAFSYDGKYVATGAYDGTVRIWLAENGSLVHALEGPSKEVEWMLWHPKGHVILAGSTDTMAWMWWAPTGKLMQIFAGHAQSVTSGAWGLAGKVIVTGSEDKSVIVWNPRQGSPQHHIKQVHDGSIVAMCAHPEGPLVVTGSEDATARVIQVETGKVVANLSGHLDSVETLAFNNAPTNGLLLLATGSMDGKVLIWDGKTFDQRCVLTEHFEKGGITKLKWLPSTCATLICTTATDATVRLHNALTGMCLHTFRGHRDTVLDLDLVLVDTNLCVVSASDDKSCRVFVKDLRSLEQQQQQAAANAAASASSSAATGGAFQPPARSQAAPETAAPQGAGAASPASTGAGGPTASGASDASAGIV